MKTNTKGDKLFGKRIKELREKKGLTQEQLSELVEMDPRSLSRIETGSNFTTVEKLKKIAQILDVEVKDLFEFNLKKSKVNYIQDIVNLLNSSSEEQVELIYKIVINILR